MRHRAGRHAGRHPVFLVWDVWEVPSRKPVSRYDVKNCG